MKLLVGFLMAALVLSCWAVEKITSVTVDGVSYLQIQDAHIVSGGRVALLYPSGGTTVPADKLSKAFLDSWGITADKLTAVSAATEKEKQEELDKAISGGLFRQIEGMVYDLRKPQAGWVRLAGARILAVSQDAALADLSTDRTKPLPIIIRNLPPVYADGDTVSVFAKSTEPFSVMTQKGEKTLRSYDAGVVCARNEIPQGILKDGLSFAPLPNRPRTRERAFSFDPDHTHLRAVGSGFFVTRDGYLVTNHHVVEGAQAIKVQYQDHELKAKVVADDDTNDLAVLKVEGDNFQPLSISSKETANLGQEVFTIGFPNIQMQGLEPKYTDGKISSLKGMQDDPTQYQISVPVQPGNSGGPLCDVNGQVVGIVVARLNDMAMLETAGVVPQNVNYAVKAGLVARLLRNIKGVGLQQNPAGRPEDAVKTVQDAIAMVKIY